MNLVSLYAQKSRYAVCKITSVNYLGNVLFLKGKWYKILGRWVTSDGKYHVSLKNENGVITGYLEDKFDVISSVRPV